MSFIDKFNQSIKGVMAMRTPELMERMPEVEAMSFDERVALVKRGQANIDAIIKGWNKFSDILLAQGWAKPEVKRKAKGFKVAKGHLANAMRLTDEKLPPPFRPQAEMAFNTLVAWFLVDSGYLESLLTGPAVKPAALSAETVPARPEVLPETAPADMRGMGSSPSIRLHDEDELFGADIGEAVMDGPSDARDATESEDVIEAAGGSRVHH